MLDAGREFAHQPLELAALGADVGDQRTQGIVAAAERGVDRLLVGGEFARHVRQRGGVRPQPFDETFAVLAAEAGDAIELADLGGDRAERALQAEHAVAKIALDFAEPAAGARRPRGRARRRSGRAFPARAPVRRAAGRRSRIVTSPRLCAPSSSVARRLALEASRSCDSFSKRLVSASLDCRVAASAVPRSAALAPSSSSVTRCRCCATAFVVREAAASAADSRRCEEPSISRVKRASRPPIASLERTAAPSAACRNAEADSPIPR